MKNSRDQFSLALPQPVPILDRLWQPHEIFERLDRDNLAHFAEDRRVERKSARTQPKTVAEYLSMWANTPPSGGIVLIGIENNGDISGCNDIGAPHMNSLEFYSELCPDAKVTIRQISVRNKDGKIDYVLALLIGFREDKLVELSNGEAYIRESDNKIKLGEVLKREIRIARGEIQHELERCLLVFPLEFDMEQVSAFCIKFARGRRIPSKRTDIEVLELAKLGRRRNDIFEPNLACALLFALDPRNVIPGARIRVIRYEGRFEGFGSNLNSVFSTYIDGNIARLLSEVKSVVSSQLRSFQRYDGSGKLAVKEEYPEEA